MKNLKVLLWQPTPVSPSTDQCEMVDQYKYAKELPEGIQVKTELISFGRAQNLSQNSLSQADAVLVCLPDLFDLQQARDMITELRARCLLETVHVCWIKNIGVPTPGISKTKQRFAHFRNSRDPHIKAVHSVAHMSAVGTTPGTYRVYEAVAEIFEFSKIKKEQLQVVRKAEAEEAAAREHQEEEARIRSEKAAFLGPRIAIGAAIGLGASGVTLSLVQAYTVLNLGPLSAAEAVPIILVSAALLGVVAGAVVGAKSEGYKSIG